MNTYTEDVNAVVDQLPFEKQPNIYVMDTENNNLTLYLPLPNPDDAVIGVINSGTGQVAVLGTLFDGSSHTLTEQYQTTFFCADAEAGIWRILSEYGASGGFIRQASAALTNAQIKALPTTPVTIVAAPGANRLIVPHVILAHMKWVADYTNIDPTSSISIDTSGNFTIALADNTLHGVEALLAGGGPDGTWVAFTIRQMAVSETTTATPAVNPHFHQGVADSGFYDADIVNIPLRISMENLAAGNLTGGNAGNVLQISVAYSVLNTITGQFV